MSETQGQEKPAPSLPAIEEPSLKFRLPEMKEVDIFVVELEDGTTVARTAAELEEAGLWPGDETAEEG